MHRVLIYFFFGLQVYSSVTVIFIMTRKKETMQRIKPYAGALYENYDEIGVTEYK